ERELLAQIYQLLKENSGEIPAYLLLPGEGQTTRRVPIPFGVYINGSLEKELEYLGCTIESR
ncbi:MAG: hypothetical protein WD988_04920, partial [Candidatus Curtissbacteria bacterium]